MENNLNMDLLNIYDDLYEEIKHIYEGLIISQPLNSINDIIKRNFPRYIYQPKYDINELEIFLYIKEQKIPDIEQLNKLIENLGWYISLIRINYTGGKYQLISYEYLRSNKPNFHNTFSIILYCEAKFDIIYDKSISYLYHITTSNKINKIKQIGLTPKSNNKKTTHSERIYFTINKQSALELYSKFKRDKPHQEFSLIIINGKEIRNLRLFKDPNFKHGLYTYQNIPPLFIDNIEILN